MTTIATNNSAVSPKIYSWGFFSPAIHSPRLRQRHKHPPNSPELPLFLILSQVFARFEHFSHQNLSQPPRFEFGISCFNPTIMQNKPNLRNAQMNVTAYGHKNYINIRLPGPRKNKPKTNPISNKHQTCTLTAQPLTQMKISIAP